MFLVNLIGYIGKTPVVQKDNNEINIIKFPLVVATPIGTETKWSWFECSLKSQNSSIVEQLKLDRYIFVNGNAIFAEKEHEDNKYPYVHVFVDKINILN